MAAVAIALIFNQLDFDQVGKSTPEPPPRTCYPQQFTRFGAFVFKICFKVLPALHYRSIICVDKYKWPNLGLKVVKSVILCQQVVILEIFIH